MGDARCTPLDVGGDGRFRIPPVDDYFRDPRRHAFFARVDGNLAGFALVHEWSHLTDDASVRDIAEFFVMLRYRRRLVGENPSASVFWRRVIGRYTGGNFEDLLWDDGRWRGPVQRFLAG